MPHSSNDPGALDRRQFLTRLSGAALGATAGVALLKSASAAPEIERRNEQPTMVYRPFGKTGLNVSRISYGCLQLRDDLLPALDIAVERGLNLLHIADNYSRGQSILSLAKFLKKPGVRDKVWIMVKGAHGSGIDIAKFEGNLKTLGIENADIICAPIFEPDAIRKSEQEVEKLETLKKAGKVRFLNLTSHTSPREAIEAGVDAGWYSSILSVIDTSTVERFQPAIARANQANVGMMAMKTTRNARGKAPADIVQGLFAAGVDTLLRSLNTREDVDAWFAAVVEAGKTAALPTTVAGAACDGDCELCGGCSRVCPNGVATQDIVRDFTYYYEQNGRPDLAAERYAELRPGATALACGDCGRCEAQCPRHMPIRRILREAHARLATA